MKSLALAPLAAVLALPTAGHAQFTGEQLVAAQPRTVAPFGYGTVSEVFTTSPGRTGAAWCKAEVSRAATCLSVSGGASCAAPAAAGVLVSCNQSGKATVNEAAFAPVNCHGDLNGDGGASGELTGADWCGWASYMAQRTIDTVYQYNDYVRLGVNKRFGGTVFELYGTDKLDRIMQAPGGAMQLALYGDDIGYAPPGTPAGWFAGWLGDASKGDDFNMPHPQKWDNTAYPSQAACSAAHPGIPCTYEMAAGNVSDDVTNVGCANDGQDAGAHFNPIQAVSADCWYGDPSNAVDRTTSPAPGTLSVSKTAPYNYSKSSSVPGLTWTQTSKVIGPFAQLTYDIVGDNTLRTMTPDFQELPAIFTHGDIVGTVYYYRGSNPYNSLGEPVSRVGLATGAVGVLGFPPRTGQYGAGFSVQMTEDWASMCNSAGTRCITIASFSNDAQIIEAANNAASNNSYFGIHGFFTLKPGLKERVTVFIAPYRFDDVVGGQTVRQWVYQLHQNPLLPPAVD